MQPESAQTGMKPRTRRLVFWAVLCLLLVASRLAHRTVLWTDEDYHLAASIQLLHGKVPYRDLWYDKPPLNAMLLTVASIANDGPPGSLDVWPLRLLGAGLATLVCWLGFAFARELWGRRQGYLAAALLALFQIFYFGHATIPLEPDTLMLAPHLAAVYLAWRGRSFAAGLTAGAALLFNPKGVFVIASALLFAGSGWWLLLAGAAVANGAVLGWLASEGALTGYFDQVWHWGWLYSQAPPPDLPFSQALVNLLNWTGFHLLLVLGAAWYYLSGGRIDAAPDGGDRNHRNLGWKLGGWCLLSLAACSAGFRFSPHYLNQMLPSLAILAAGGLAAMFDHRSNGWRKASLVAAVVLVAVSLIRFTPDYVRLAADDFAGRAHDLSAAHMDQDARRALDMVEQVVQPGDTVFVWGYRPNLVAYTGLPVAGRFWDSQPLTGVPADRHFAYTDSLDPEWAARNRAEMVQSTPDIFIDGLSPYNPELNITSFPETAAWFEQYCLVGDTMKGIRVYTHCERLQGQP